METLTELKDFVSNPGYWQQRQQSLGALDITTIDPPIVDIVRDLGRVSCCFTLQSCFGHFLHAGQDDPRNAERLPLSAGTSDVEYRIAYMALCIEESEPGRALFDDLGRMAAIDPQYIQFGCADWFWERQVNSYVLQVEPARCKAQDRAIITYLEAVQTERVRDRFFAEIRLLVRNHLRASVGGGAVPGTSFTLPPRTGAHIRRRRSTSHS